MDLSDIDNEIVWVLEELIIFFRIQILYGYPLRITSPSKRKLTSSDLSRTISLLNEYP